MSNDINIKEVKDSLNPDEFVFVCQILKNENGESILANLSPSLIKKYFEILVNSKNLFLFFCKYENKHVGYAILSRKPSFLMDEFKTLKYSILFNLITNLKFKTLANILFSILRLDLIFLSNQKKKIINESFNLNLLAIKSEFQSKGIGKKFILKVLDIIKEKNNSDLITVETNNKRTENFYIQKLNFFHIGKKIRLFKNLNIFQKNLK